MKCIELETVKHDRKVGQICEPIAPNIIEDCIFYAEGNPIGFYMRDLPPKLKQFVEIANKEFRSENVPKTNLDRSDIVKMNKETGIPRAKLLKMGLGTRQMSTILGSIPPKPHMRRPYATMSSVHSVKSATTFIKAMLLAAKESEKLIQEIIPEQYEKQLGIFKNVPEKWKFGKLFTSSISNYNIPAPFHRDAGNIIDCCNVIITKRRNSYGGNLHIPDYNATIDQSDNSILVYPAWRNMHGVTPIEPTHEGGYRNSLVFYPLKAFLNIDKK